MTFRPAALVAGLVTCALAMAARAPAEPAPAPPPPGPGLPVPSELIPAIGGVLAQKGSQPVGPFGLPDVSGYASTLLLGQTALPAPPSVSAAAVPDLSAFNPEYLLPLNTAPAAPGEGVPAAGIGPDEESTGTGRLAFLRRLYAMYQGGDLTGALLGQAEPGELGDRLPEADPPK